MSETDRENMKLAKGKKKLNRVFCWRQAYGISLPRQLAEGVVAGPAKEAARLIRIVRIPYVEAKGDGVN